MTLLRSPKCDRIRSQLSLELDGELSQLERALLAAHLRRCAACCVFRDDLVAFTAALREAPLERLEHPVVLPRRRRARFATAHVAAAVASIAIALGLGLNASDFVRSAGLDSRATKRPAYLDSAQYELRIIERVRDTRLAQRISRAL